MCRLTIVLFLALSHYVVCNIVAARVTKDIPMEEDNAVDLPTLNAAVPNVADEKCAKAGEFCINHKDCCSNACLGYMRRCVSGKEFVED